MRTHIEDLELAVEHWRARAEAAESALRGVEWETPVRPLSLYQTRVLRVLVMRDATGDQLVQAMGADYEQTSGNALKAQLSKMRRLLPAHIVPPCNVPAGWGVSAVYTIPDRPALAEFLASGQLPLRRAA
jgi:hypothetical protein